MSGNGTRALVIVLLSLGALILTQPAAIADVVPIHLIGAGSDVSHSVYISPYSAVIGTGQTAVSVVCDDFFDDTYIPESWNATVYDGSAPDLSATRMAQESGLSGQDLDRAYDEIAYLTLMLAGENATDRALTSFAIWDVFASAPSQAKDSAAAPTVQQWFASHPDSNGPTLAQVQSLVASARLNAALGERSLLTIYSSPIGDVTCGGSACPTATPQELVTVRTPEASVPAFLAFNLALLGVVFFVLRVRHAGATS